MSKGRPRIDRERERLEDRLARVNKGLLAGYELMEEARQMRDRAEQKLSEHIVRSEGTL